MNLYRVSVKRNYVRGLQLEEESYLVVATDVKHAEKIVTSRATDVTVKGVARIQDQAYIISDTYLVDNAP